MVVIVAPAAALATLGLVFENHTHYNFPMRSRLLATFGPTIVLLALVAGCTEPPVELDPDALLAQSSETTAQQTSVHLELVVEGDIEGFTVEFLEGDLTQVPDVAAMGTADLTAFGQFLEGVQFVVWEGDIWAAITAGGGLSNFGPASAIYDVAAILDPEAGLANVLASFSDATDGGPETVGEVESVVITGTVSADAVNVIAPQIGATDPVPATAWISIDGDNELLQLRLEPSTGSSLTMSLSSWGEPVIVNNPSE